MDDIQVQTQEAKDLYKNDSALHEQGNINRTFADNGVMNRIGEGSSYE